MMQRKVEEYYPNIQHKSNFGFHFGTICLPLSSSSVSFWRPGFRNLCGAPLGSILASPGAPLIRFSSLFKIIYDQNLPTNFKDSRAAFETSETKCHQPHLKKIKQGLNKNEPLINPNKFVLVVFVYQTRASPKPQVCFL